MRTITRSYEVYPLVELSDRAREKAYYNWLDNFYYGYSGDNRQTLDAFCGLFNVVCHKWEYDSTTYHFRCYTNHSDTVEELSGQRLATYLSNNYWSSLFPKKLYWKKGKKRQSRIFYDNCCPLTGYYLDNEILQPVYDFINKPDSNITFLSLIKKCLDSFFSACRDDMSDCQSEESFRDDADANQWEYLSDGRLFS